MGFFDFLKKKEKEETDTLELEIETTEENSDTEAEVVAQEPLLQKEEEEVINNPELEIEVTEENSDTETVVEEPSFQEEETESEIPFEAVLEPQEEEADSLFKSEADLKPEDTEEKQGFFSKIVQGLTKTREAISGTFDAIINSFTSIDDDLMDELEEALIMADVGTQTALRIVELLRVRIKETGETNPQALKGMMEEIIAEMLAGDYSLHLETKPSVILVIGVNGAGKTTSIGKMAHLFNQEGRSVLVAAADTFRAAAIEQLEVWTERAQVDIVKHQEGSDPAAVIYDAIQAGKARGKDIIICDTAGRLHNKKNLMDELGKIRRIIDRELPNGDVESLLVLDGTTGQNALNQARQFKEVADITGIILTKLDGTAKGGVVVGIKEELGIPIKFIGVGEQINDLRPFDPVAFASGLFTSEGE